MRSEREAGPGPARGGGRDKGPMEAPPRRESPRRDSEAPLTPSPPPLPGGPPPPPPPPLHPAPGKPREEKKTALSKVVIRRLPPCLTKEQLEEQLHPLPAHDYFEFCTADPRDGCDRYPRLNSRLCSVPLQNTAELNSFLTLTLACNLQPVSQALMAVCADRHLRKGGGSECSGRSVKQGLGRSPGGPNPKERKLQLVQRLLNVAQAAGAERAPAAESFLALLYPHLYSRAYINFRNPEDILLFRDRFDGYVFIDNKGLEYPAVVEFAPFQKISKKKLKKKDAKAGSIEDDPEYRKFLESYCADEEKICANPETLLGEIEAKTRELIARRTTPLLEYIKNRKLEKQRIREEKREERRRRELEKKRLREEEKRKRREEERRKRKEAEKQKKISEKEIRIKLLKKPEKGDEQASEKHKEKGEEADTEENKWEKSSGSGSTKSKAVEGSLKELKEKSQNDSDKEQRDLERRFREKDPERPRYRLDDGRKHRAHYEYDKFVRRSEDELKWGKGYSQDRGKKGTHSYSFTVDTVDKLGKEDKCDDMASKKERIRNKDRPAMQLYQPGARIRTHAGAASRTWDCTRKTLEDALDKKSEADNSAGGGSEKSEEAE